jgi:thymidine phosphorylase
MKIYFTDMNVPLGYGVGNGIEVIESLEILSGELKNDCYELSIEFVKGMCEIAGIRKDPEEYIKNGEGMRRFEKMVRLQGGNLKEIELNKNVSEIKSEKDGLILDIDANKIAQGFLLTGAGRMRKEDKIDYGAGIRLLKFIGESVKKNETLALVYTSREIEKIIPYIRDAYKIGKGNVEKRKRIIEVW